VSFSEKVLVIGLDGTSLDLIGPWMKQGLLPNLSKFQTEGIVTTLVSVIPPQTASGWSSIATGKNPGKHGMFGFLKRDPRGYDLIPVSSADRKSMELWEILSNFGKKVGVVDIPLTYPVRKVNGFFISGALTPYGVDDYYQPPGLLDELNRNIGEYLPPYSYFLGDEDAFLAKLYAFTENHGEAVKYLIKQRDWNFFMLVFYGTDMIQHAFWKYMDLDPRKTSDAKKAKYRNAILQYYQKVDSIIGEIIAKVGDDTTILVVSDHGAERLTKWIHPNVFLMNEGLLCVRRGIREQTRYLFFKMGLTPLNVVRLAVRLKALQYAKRMGKTKTRRFLTLFLLSLKDIDWSKSKAYSFGGWGRIFLNVKGNNPTGIIDPAEYETVRSQIVQRLRAITDPETGEKLCTEVYLKEQLYSGPHLAEAPDIVFKPRPGYFPFPDYEFGSNTIVSQIKGWSAGHSLNGVLMMKGRNVEAHASVNNASIMDVAPTILAVMGLPVPTDMDGRVLTEGLSPELREKISKSDYNTQVAAEHSYSEDQADELIATLKGLGYL
jgi:predicted AlkP superfamily phosphohydrolase/phosphomutase